MSDDSFAILRGGYRLFVKRVAVQTVLCLECGSPPLAPCRTRAGGRAETHHRRYLVALEMLEQAGLTQWRKEWT